MLESPSYMKTYFIYQLFSTPQTFFFIQMLTFESNNCWSTFAYINDTPSSSTFPFLKHKGIVITELILGRPKWTSTHLLSSVSSSLHSFCSHDSSSGRTEYAVKFYWWAWYEAQIPCKDEYISYVSLFILWASRLRARSGCYSMAIIGVINVIFLTQQWDWTASLETKRKEEEKKSTGMERRENKNFWAATSPESGW